MHPLAILFIVLASMNIVVAYIRRDINYGLMAACWLITEIQLSAYR